MPSGAGEQLPRQRRIWIHSPGQQHHWGIIVATSVVAESADSLVELTDAAVVSGPAASTELVDDVAHAPRARNTVSDRTTTTYVVRVFINTSLLEKLGVLRSALPTRPCRQSQRKFALLSTNAQSQFVFANHRDVLARGSPGGTMAIAFRSSSGIGLSRPAVRWRTRGNPVILRNTRRMLYAARDELGKTKRRTRPADHTCQPFSWLSALSNTLSAR